MKPLVSIIVPVYNAEKWLNKCITSIISQSYKNLEILLIDDGSTDASAMICDDIASLDNRVKVTHRRNTGVSGTRNYGLATAKGKYIAFVDADDYLDLNIIEHAVSAIQNSKTKLCIWNVATVEGKNTYNEPDIFLEKYTKEELFSTLVSGYQGKYNIGKYIRAVWGKLFDAELFFSNDIWFDEKLYIGEDAVFLCECLKYIEELCVLNEIGYYYRLLDNSAVRKYKKDLLEQSFLQLEAFEAFMRTEMNGLSTVVNDAITVFAWEIFRNLLVNQNKSNDIRKVDFYDDAWNWFEKNENRMKVLRIFTSYIPKIAKMQMVLSYCTPFSFQCKIAILYMCYQK